MYLNSSLFSFKGPISDESQFELNLRYNNKRTKFKLLPVTRAQMIQVVGFVVMAHVWLPHLIVWICLGNRRVGSILNLPHFNEHRYSSPLHRCFTFAIFNGAATNFLTHMGWMARLTRLCHDGTDIFGEIESQASGDSPSRVQRLLIKLSRHSIRCFRSVDWNVLAAFCYYEQ